jgi:hypothetical protein
VGLLYTCHNAHFAFETLRRKYHVPWEQIGVIEDGIGSYFPWRMLPLRRQVLRAAVALLAVGHPLSVARWDVGGDSRVGFVSTLAPSLVHLSQSSRATIVDLRDSVRAVLNELTLEPPREYGDADVLLFLPPVLCYERLTPSQLADYVGYVRSHPAIGEEASILVKPHPRDPTAAVRSALAPLAPAVTVGGDEPIEIYLSRISIPLWAGSPTTGMLNHVLLYPDRSTRYALFPIAGNPNVQTQVDVLRKVLGPALVDVARTFDGSRD